MRNALLRVASVGAFFVACGGEHDAPEPTESPTNGAAPSEPAGASSGATSSTSNGGAGAGSTSRAGTSADGASAPAGASGNSAPGSPSGAAGSSGSPSGAAGSSGGPSGAAGTSAGGASAAVGGSGGSAGSAGSAAAGAGGFASVYSATCAICHGSSGTGVSGRGPEIQHPTRALYDFLLRNGEAHPLTAYVAPMPPFADTLVSSADAAAIFDWLAAMPQPTTGAALFADYCSYCHGADGRGGTAGVAYATAYHSAPFRRQGVEFRNFVRAGHVVDDKGAAVPVSSRRAYMPPFPPAMLSDAELTLIENWLPK